MTAIPDTLLDGDIDRQLLGLLRHDARQPVTSLAAALKISRASVYARIEKLERRGIIAGYTIKLGDAYDHRLIRAHVMLKMSPKRARGIEANLARLPSLTGLHAISGEYDLIAMIEAEDVASLNAIIDQIGEMDGIEKTTSSILLASKIKR